MNYFPAQFPAINSFTRKCWGYAETFGHTETVSGRRRYFPHINHASPVIRAQARRQAVNFCVQGKIYHRATNQTCSFIASLITCIFYYCFHNNTAFSSHSSSYSSSMVIFTDLAKITFLNF